MEILKNEKPAQEKAKKDANIVQAKIDNSPENKAVIYPEDKKARI